MGKGKISSSLVRRIVNDVNPRELLRESVWNKNYNVQVTDAVKVNRKVIDSVKQLEARGEIPAKTARRMIDAVRWQNTIDAAQDVAESTERAALKRSSRRFQAKKPYGYELTRPAIGKTKRFEATPTEREKTFYNLHGRIEPVKVKMRGRVRNFDGRMETLTSKEKADLLSRAIGEVRTSKIKVKKPSKEQMLGMMRDSLAYSQLRQLNREMKRVNSSRINPLSYLFYYRTDRVPSNRRDKVIASMAEKYRLLRNKYDDYDRMPKTYPSNPRFSGNLSLKDIFLK